MPATKTPRDEWVEAGLRALADGGIESVRIESLARSLGVTKGGFYGYFADRPALLRAMLDTWEREVVDDVVRAVEAMSDDPVERARLAGQLTFSGRMRPMDWAIRDWARRDPTATERLIRVDNRRMELVRDAIASYVSDPTEIRARSLLAFCMAISIPLVGPDHPDWLADGVRDLAVEVLLGRPSDLSEQAR